MAALTTLLLYLLKFSSIVTALPYYPSPQSPVQTIYEFPNRTWVENIAVRSTGQLLVNLLTTPDLYQVDPFSPTQPIFVHSFPNVTSLFGIAEIQTDIFAIVAGNWSVETFSTTNGSYSIWEVDLRPFKYDKNGRPTSKAIVTKIASIPEASFLNGLTLLAPSSPYLLIADSVLGVVWRLDYHTAEYSIVLDNALMKPVPTPPILGINGLHTRSNFLYFTNSFQGLFARVPISNVGTATGPYEIIAHNGPSDDFAFDKDGNAYIAQNLGDALQQVTPKGMVKTLAGNVNLTTLEGDTAAAFGRTRRDKNLLYVVTNGGLAGQVPGTDIVGGKVLAVDVNALLNRQ